MTTPTSVEELCNIALMRLGYPELIGNIYEGTKQARAGLYLYAETRDNLLRLKNWQFAFQQAAGVASGTPPVGWAYSWAYPANCIRIRDIAPTLTNPDNDPLPILWQIFNSGSLRYIATQVAPITINYIGQVVDITQWEPGFVDAMITNLAARMGPLLRKMGEETINPYRSVEEAINVNESQAPNDVMAEPQPPARGQRA